MKNKIVVKIGPWYWRWGGWLLDVWKQDRLIKKYGEAAWCAKCGRIKRTGTTCRCGSSEENAWVRESENEVFFYDPTKDVDKMNRFISPTMNWNDNPPKLGLEDELIFDTENGPKTLNELQASHSTQGGEPSGQEPKV